MRDFERRKAEFDREFGRAVRWAKVISVFSGLVYLAILGGLGWAGYKLITWIVSQ